MAEEEKGMTSLSVPLARASDRARDLSALAETLSKELNDRFAHVMSRDKPEIALMASLLKERLAAHRDDLEALADQDAAS
jgi:hypothetical protein